MCGGVCCAGDLNSGKDDARAARKQLIKKVEALIEKLESQVRSFDQLRAEQPSP